MILAWSMSGTLKTGSSYLNSKHFRVIRSQQLHLTQQEEDLLQVLQKEKSDSGIFQMDKNLALVFTIMITQILIMKIEKTIMRNYISTNNIVKSKKKMKNKRLVRKKMKIAFLPQRRLRSQGLSMSKKRGHKA